MKHTLQVTLVLIFLFLASQVIGLAITSRYVKLGKTPEGIIEVVDIEPLPYNIERPPVQGNQSFIYISVAILIATILILVLVRFKQTSLWKVWFFLAIFFCLTIAFNAFMPSLIAVILALVIAYFKICRPSLLIQNFSEIFVYSGLAAIFVPIMNLFAAFGLLALISLYDMIAVWKTKHMIQLAKFQTKAKIFAGLLIPYKMPLGKKKGKRVPAALKTAILGGGDMGIPLLFTGVVMKSTGFSKALLISLFATIALLFLLLKARKGKFYPAMPFISAGCVLGYLAVLLLQ